MPNCVILNCSNSTSKVGRRNGDISFHRFPQDPIIKDKWTEVTGRINWVPTKFSSICSRHFTTDSFLVLAPKRRLRHTAIPTIAVLRNETTIRTQSSVSRKRNLDKICRICLCQDRKMYNMEKYDIIQQYEKLTAIKECNNDTLPQYICWECKARLSSFAKLRTAALRSLELLQSYYDTVTRDDDAINLPFMIDREANNLTSTLSKKIFNDDLENHHFIHTDTHIIEISEREVKTKIEYIDDFDNRLNSDDENALVDIKTENHIIEDSNLDDYDQKLEIEFDNLNENLNNENLTERNKNLNNENLTERNDNFVSSKTETIKDIDLELDDKSDFNISDDEKLVKTAKNRRKSIANSEFDGKNDVNSSDDEKLVKTAKNSKKNTKAKNVREIACNKDMFEVIELSHEEQLDEIEKRKETDNYKFCEFKCDVCYKGFSVKNTYLAHVNKHTDQCGAHECDVCKVRYKLRRILKHHKFATHLYKYSCKMCNFVTTTRPAVKLHEKYHSGIKYKCPHCDKEFERQSTYMSHIRIKHPSDIVCALCGYSFLNRKGLLMHNNLKHRFEEQQIPVDGPRCEECNIRFFNEEALNIHYQQSDKHEQAIVPKKNYRSYYKSGKNGDDNIIIRRDRRHNTGPVQCEVCDTQLPNSMAYNKHFRQHHRDKNRTYFPIKRDRRMCEVCGRTFMSLYHLRDHSFTHSETKQFSCEQCGKLFETKIKLRMHEQIHLKRQYPCKDCGRVFSSPNNLSRHRINHMGLKFECEICGKCFKHPSNKKAHVDYVHLNKPLPKRNRNKRKGDKNSQVESAGSEEAGLGTPTC